MAESEAGKTKGKAKKLRKKRQPPKELPIDDGSQSPPQLSDIDSSSSKSYVIEWLCAHPYPSTPLGLHSPAEDPPSFHDIYHHNLEKVPSINSSRTSFMVNRRRPESVAEIFCHTSTPGVEKEEMLPCGQVAQGEPNQPRSPARPDHPCANPPNGLNNYAQTICYCSCGHSGACRHGRRCSAPTANPAGFPEKLSNKPGRKQNRISSNNDQGDRVKSDSEKPVRLEDGIGGKDASNTPGTVNLQPSQLAEGDTWSTEAGEYSKGATALQTSSLHHKRKPRQGLPLKTLGITVSLGERTISVGERTVSAGDRTVSAGDRTVSVGDRTVSAGDRTVSVGDRRIELQVAESAHNASTPAAALSKHVNVTQPNVKHHWPPENPPKETCPLPKCPATKIKVKAATVKGQCPEDAVPSVQENKLTAAESLHRHSVQAGEGPRPPRNIEAGEDVVRLPGGEERQLTGQMSQQVSALAQHFEAGSGCQNIGEEDLEYQTLRERVGTSGEDKDVHVSGVSVSLEKMTTEEVCEWLIDAGFQSCVQRVKELGITGQHLANTDPELFDQLKLQGTEDREHLLFALYQQLNPSDLNVKQILGDQSKANEQQAEEPWTMKERCSTAGSDKGADTYGAAIPLERMTTEEVCKWLTDSGFEAYVPHIREFGITGRQLANTDSELFNQLQLRDAEDRERLLFALYQELNPSDMNVEEILGYDCSLGASLTCLACTHPRPLARRRNTHRNSYIILEDSTLESIIKNPQVDKLYTSQPQRTAQQTTTELLQPPPAAPDRDQMVVGAWYALSQGMVEAETTASFQGKVDEYLKQIQDTKMNLLSRRVLELAQSVETRLQEAGHHIQDLALRKPVDPALLEDKLNCIQRMMEEMEGSVQQTDIRKQARILDNRKQAKASVEEAILELHFIQQKLALIQLKEQFSRVKTLLFVNNLQNTLQQGKKPLSSLVPSSGQLLQVDIDMDPREWSFTVDIDSEGIPKVTSSMVPALTAGDMLIEINGISTLDCSMATLEQVFGQASTARILVLRSGGKQCIKSMEEACSLESALTELTNLQSEFIAASVELSALRNEKGVMWAEIEKLQARESLLLQENKRVLQSADSLKQLLERSEYRWMFLKEQLETMKGAFHLETRKLDTVEARLKEEIDALKLKSCQDDKKIKDLAKALKEKNAKSEQMKIAQRHKYQVDVTEGNWLPEHLEELQMFRKQCQPLQHSDNQAQPPDQEWPYPQGQWADYQVTHPDSELQSKQSQWLDHQACGDQQLQCPQVPHLEDQGYNADDEWSCPQGEWFRLQARHPDQELRCQWHNHQPHCSQQELQPQQGQWLDCLVQYPDQALQHQLGHCVDRPDQDLQPQQCQWLDFQIHRPDQELQCQQGKWLHYQGDALGQQWQYAQDRQPGLKSPHSDREPQVQQGQSAECLQGDELQFRQDQPFGQLEQQEGNPQPDHQIHYSDQQGQEPNNQSDLDEEQQGQQVHQPAQQQQSPQADLQSRHLDQRCQKQMPDPQATQPNKEQQRCDAEKSAQLSKLPSQHLDHQNDPPGSKTQQRAKLPPRSHVCRRSRHHQTQPHCSQPKLPKEHLLRLSVKLGEHFPSTPQNKQKLPCEKEPPVPAQPRQHRRKRTSHHSANERHPFSDTVFGPDSPNTKLHKEQRAEVILTAQDTAKENAAKKKQLAQLLQMVASHTSHLLKGHVAKNN